MQLPGGYEGTLVELVEACTERVAIPACNTPRCCPIRPIGFCLHFSEHLQRKEITFFVGKMIGEIYEN